MFMVFLSVLGFGLVKRFGIDVSMTVKGIFYVHPNLEYLFGNSCISSKKLSPEN